MIAAATAQSTGLPLWVICALTFGAILFGGLVLIVVPNARAHQRARDKRLGELRRYRLLGAYGSSVQPEAGTQASTERPIITRALAAIDHIVRARGYRAPLVDRLGRCGLRMRPEEWVAIETSAIVATAAIGAFLVSPLIGLVAGGALGWLACWGFLRVRAARRVAAFEAQLPDALQLVAGALRAGFALNQSIGAVARESGTEPVAGEFARVLQEVRLGADLETALEDLATRMDSYDLQLVVMAIRTSREIGGNLAEVLQTTVETMRERVQLRSQVRVLSAEGRFSAKVLTGLPLLMAGYLLLFRKAYLRPMYTTSLGVAILIAGVALLVVGAVWLSRLTKIEV